ncbi:MAG: hypothetical protein ACI9A2_002254 [Halioglobus sp.]|jgi:hypothetical protein
MGKFVFCLFLLSLGICAEAHEVDHEDILKMHAVAGVQLGHYIWLGAKHMVTGYDHLLFLLGVIFYIVRLRDVLILVSLFALGHSVTLIPGVLFSWSVNAYLIDAIIGFSVVYKGVDNLGGLTTIFGERPKEKIVVFVFGLFHGLGLATKLQTLAVRDDGLIANLLAFNIGVELGQVVALLVALCLLNYVPVLRDNRIVATSVNVAIVAAGVALIAYQLNQYFYAA